MIKDLLCFVAFLAGYIGIIYINAGIYLLYIYLGGIYLFLLKKLVYSNKDVATMARGPKDLAGRRLEEFSRLEEIIDKVINESRSHNILICVDDLPNYSDYEDEIQQAYLNAGWSEVSFVYGWDDPTYLKLTYHVTK